MENVPSEMQAVVLRGHGDLDVVQADRVPVPAPGPDEVLVDVAAVALNNTDLWTREGAYGTSDDPDARSGWRGPIDFPRIQGADVAGTVRAVGSSVGSEWIGRRVLVDPSIYDGPGDDADPVGLMGSERDGGYAEFVAVPADQVHDMTDSPLTDQELAALPTAYGTAFGMLERGRAGAGDVVLVSGASGGVGLAAVQLAKARGAHVVAISSAGKAEAVRAAGADVVVDRGQDDLVRAVRDASDGGIDVAVDVVAGRLVSDLVPVLREGGRWVVAGALGGHEVHLDIRRLYLHNKQLIGSSMHTRAHFRQLTDLARAGAFRPVIAQTWPLEEAAAAQEALATRGHVGKLLLVPGRP
ncbi:zinc-binding dehydrogenase [Curtobacterium sp. L1-20]|uniref:zinc-binding dehydrogenase n=1 Tax=Curtobacterium sp. L1-20 TaxID=3138181 RepID=UPI003B52EF51